MNLRKYIFWFFDKCSKGLVGTHYEDIQQQLGNYSSTESALKRENNVRSLLSHVIQTVPYYHGISDAKLDEFPIVNKSMINIDLDRFLSKNYQLSKLSKTTTSGSTGTPFTIYKDQNKLKRHQAENIYFSKLAGYEIGTNLIYLRVWNNVNRKSKWSEFVQNISAEEISNSSDGIIKKLFLKIHSSGGSLSILGFSSTLESIARYIERNQLRPIEMSKVVSIQAMSEYLPTDARKILMDYFRCTVVSRYSNMENGFIAQQFSQNEEKYAINHASYHIEIFDIDKDIGVEDGQIGRIVVTDLFNYGMPLVRYDTGDIGAKLVDPIMGPILSSIEGRKVDFIYNTSDELLSPHSITNTMWNYTEVAQFQFTQKSANQYVMLLNVDANRFQREVELIDQLKVYLGKDAMISIVYTQEIPLLASGKRKKIVNDYKR